MALTSLEIEANIKCLKKVSQENGRGGEETMKDSTVEAVPTIQASGDSDQGVVKW